VTRNAQKEFLIGQSSRSHATYRRPSLDGFQFVAVVTRERCRLMMLLKASKIVSERKAVVTVASVVVAFAVCWVPYFSVFVIKPSLFTD